MRGDGGGGGRPDGGHLRGLGDAGLGEVVGQDLLGAAGVIQRQLGRFALDPHPRRDGVPQGTLGLGACRGHKHTALRAMTSGGRCAWYGHRFKAHGPVFVQRTVMMDLGFPAWDCVDMRRDENAILMLPSCGLILTAQHSKGPVCKNNRSVQGLHGGLQARFVSRLWLKLKRESFPRLCLLCRTAFGLISRIFQSGRISREKGAKCVDN